MEVAINCFNFAHLEKVLNRANQQRHHLQNKSVLNSVTY